MSSFDQPPTQHTDSSPGEEGQPLRVFLCYCPLDRLTVRHLYQRLRQDGLELWPGEENLLPDQDWEQEIRKAIHHSQAILICLSPTALSDPDFTHKTIKLVVDVTKEQPEGTIFIIPLKLQECELPERLSKLQPVNYFEADGYPLLLKTLQQRATTLTAVMPPEPPSPTDLPQPNRPESHQTALATPSADEKGWGDTINAPGSQGYINRPVNTKINQQFINQVEDAYNVHGLVNPYLGLRSFTYTDRTLYGGRQKIIEVACKKLTERNAPLSLLFITGASGSGKSSFAQAGLVPALEEYYSQEDLTTRYAVFRPSEKPLVELHHALARLQLHPETWPTPLDTAEQLSRFLVDRTSKNQVNLLVIDQFEELFTPKSQPQQREVIFALMNTLPPFEQTHTHIIATFRSDYLPELFKQGQIYDRNRQEIPLRAMTVEELKEAIQRPLQSYQALQPGHEFYHPNYAHKKFEPELVERLALDTAKESTYLPLLQVTLQDLWRRGSLKLSAYRSLAQAIQQRAEEVYNYRDYDGEPRKLRPPEEGEQLMSIFLDLVEVSLDNEDRRDRDIRRRRLRVDLEWGKPERHLLIEDLRAARLLSSSEGREDGQIEVDLIHESLINNWPRLQEAIAQKRQNLQQRVRFEQALVEWQAKGQQASYLLEGIRLADARELERQGDIALNNPKAQEFFKLSINKDEAAKTQARLQQERIQGQQRRLRLFLVSLIAAVVIIFIAVVGLIQINEQKNIANSQRQLAHGLQVAAQARNHFSDQLDLALLLSLASKGIADTVEAKGSLLDGLMYKPAPDAFLRRHSNKVYTVAFSPDGKTLASAGADKTIILWDVASHQPIGQPLKGHNATILSVVFSPDGRTLASTGVDQTILLWKVGKWESPETLPKIHTKNISKLAFSPDSKTLASAGTDNIIILWDVASPTPQPIGQPLKGHTASVESVVFSPDGKTLASTGTDGQIILWDASGMTTQPIRTFKVPQPLLFAAYSLAFSPDGKILASGIRDSTILLWDVSSGQLIGQPLKAHTAPVLSMAFSSDGKTLISASTDYSIILWNVVSHLPIGQPLRGHTAAVRSISLNPNGTLLASGGEDNNVIFWNLTNDMPLVHPLKGHTNDVLSVAFNQDGKTLASASADQSVILWDVASHQPIGQPLRTPSKGLRSVAFSPKGNFLAAGAADSTGTNGQTLFLWDLSNPQPKAESLKGHQITVWCVAFSPDGKILASASSDKTIILWDVASRQPIGQPLKGHNGQVRSVVFSPDGKTLASASDDQSVILWDVASHQPIGQPLKGHTAIVGSLAFSPDGKFLASGGQDTTIILWDVASRQPIGQPLKGHTNGVQTIAFSPDGKTLASGSADSTIILWDLSSRQQIGQPVRIHPSTVESLAFSSDGKTLASAGGEKALLLWDINFEAWKDLACKIANRNLTEEEWKQFIGDDPPYSTRANSPSC